ncbi:hypothetical protein Tco_0442359 [Tanacetum coccineum]
MFELNKIVLNLAGALGMSLPKDDHAEFAISKIKVVVVEDQGKTSDKGWQMWDGLGLAGERQHIHNCNFRKGKIVLNLAGALGMSLPKDDHAEFAISRIKVEDQGKTSDKGWQMWDGLGLAGPISYRALLRSWLKTLSDHDTRLRSSTTLKYQLQAVSLRIQCIGDETISGRGEHQSLEESPKEENRAGTENNGGKQVRDFEMDVVRQALLKVLNPLYDTTGSSSVLPFYGRAHELPTTRSPALGIDFSSFVTQVTDINKKGQKRSQKDKTEPENGKSKESTQPHLTPPQKRTTPNWQSYGSLLDKDSRARIGRLGEEVRMDGLD